MQIGLVEIINRTTRAGSIRSTGGDLFSFSYLDGQGIVYGRDLRTPQYSGKHKQPYGFDLKEPEVGDPVIFLPSAGRVAAWSYARLFVEAAERQHGTSFLPSGVS